MAQNPSALKRQKELARLEWQKEKKEKRRLRKQEKEQTPGSDSGGARTEELK
jgi:hypothetical protein